MKNNPRALETLDETIDRVAAAMTAVPADPLLADRIVRQLNDRRSSIWTLIPAVVAVSAIALAVAWSLVDRSTSTPTAPVASMPRVDVPKNAPTPLIAPVSQQAANVTLPNNRARVRPVAQAAFAEEESPVYQIAALKEVSGIGFEDLSNELLTIAPVQVAPLDLASLEVNDIKGDDPPREQ